MTLKKLSVIHRIGGHMMSKEEFHRAKLKVKAKKFKNSIPIGMAIPLPDDLIDGLSDEDAPIFFEILDQIGLQRNGSYWERKY